MAVYKTKEYPPLVINYRLPSEIIFEAVDWRFWYNSPLGRLLGLVLALPYFLFMTMVYFVGNPIWYGIMWVITGKQPQEDGGACDRP